MKTLKLSVLLLALVMVGCSSGLPTEPGEPVVCKESDPREVCKEAVDQAYAALDGPQKGDQ